MLTEHYSEAYKIRCIKRLKERSAPVSERECLYTYDIKQDEEEEEGSDDLYTCELCDCSQVRYVHVMRHRDYFEDVSVGCICAGVMEGDILAAQDRERVMKNRAKRKINYLKRKWQCHRSGNYTMTYKNHWLMIVPFRRTSGGFGVFCDDLSVWRIKGKPILTFLSAIHAAFDLVDPPGGGKQCVRR